MNVKQETQPKNWTEVSNHRNDKLYEAIETAYLMKDVTSEAYEGVEVETFSVVATSIAFQLTEAEVNSAPQEIRMVLDDLGIIAEDDIHAQITIDTVHGRPHEFWFSLKPREITPHKLGLGLSSDGNNFVIAPTSRDFDGVHKMASTYIGKAAALHEVYVGDMGNKANPDLANILSAGVNWFRSTIDARRKPL